MQIRPDELSFNILKALTSFKSVSNFTAFLSLVWNLIFILSELNLGSKTGLELEVTKNE